MTKENTGGRIVFKRDLQVRYLTLDGRVSSDIFMIGPIDPTGQDDLEHVRSDRKGLIVIRQGSKELKIHARRILPVEIAGEVPVIESNGKYRAICPKCSYVADISANDDELDCPTCNKFPLKWLGEKPMSTTAEKVEKAEKAEKTEKVKAEKAEKTEKVKAEKPTREPVLVDFDSLKGLPNCELWTKGNVKFDHVAIDVQSHALLYTGDNPRKLCFNTYNGCLGKKSAPLPTEQFVNDSEVADAKKAKPWFVIADLDKARNSLTKNGYELQK